MKIIILLFLIIIIGCRKEPASVSEKNMDSEPNSVDAELSSDKVKAENNTTIDKKPVGYVQYGISEIPGEIKYQGSVISMAKWKDELGENIVFVTETSEKSTEDSRSKEIYGYHYILNDNGAEQLWRIYDFIKDCPVDLTLSYIDKSLEITDLDSNGIAESSFIYRMSCKGDVSSDDMKLIMHEGKEKYAIRGIMEMTLDGKPYQKGEMHMDPSFSNAPEVYSKYSESKWNKFKTDNIGK